MWDDVQSSWTLLVDTGDAEGRCRSVEWLDVGGIQRTRVSVQFELSQRVILLVYVCSARVNTNRIDFKRK